MISTLYNHYFYCILTNIRHKVTNSTTLKVGSQINRGQGRKVNSVQAYADGVANLIENKTVTRREVLQAWSIMGKKGKRTSPSSWNALLKKKGFGKGGQPASWSAGTTMLNLRLTSGGKLEDGGGKLFQEMQEAILDLLGE